MPAGIPVDPKDLTDMSNRRSKAKLDRRVQLALGRQIATAYEETRQADLPAELAVLLARLESAD
jgi:hypothetical protein